MSKIIPAGIMFLCPDWAVFEVVNSNGVRGVPKTFQLINGISVLVGTTSIQGFTFFVLSRDQDRASSKSNLRRKYGP